MKLIGTILVATFFFTSCQRNQKEHSAEKSSESKKFEMYQMSEMSALMEQMYTDNLKVKKRIKDGDTIGKFPNYLTEIHDAVMTDDKENDAFFKSQATAFVLAQERLYNDPKNAKVHFNESVNTCISCHEIKCQGPIPRIKKLYIQ